MICPTCQHVNDNHARFCDQCGELLEMRCPACNSPVRAEARFCSQCGHRLDLPSAPSQTSVEPAARSANTLSFDDKLTQLQRYVPQHLAEKILANRGRLEGERKLVTVLFADLAGYSALSEQLGEETLFGIMDDLYEAFIHQVHRFEGTVNELTGDGLVAFFGAPLAVEQAPQRAVHAALALQETAAQFRVRLAREHDVHLQLRVGINTGPVIVGSIGNNLRMDYKAVGSTVNLAARMEQTAAPGTIRLSAQTYRLVEGYFDCEDLGAVTVKGAVTRVQVYQVTGTRVGYGRIDVARERGFTRLVGRQRELALLSHCFDMLQNGRGQAISMIGDAGLGKSRLLYEYRQALAGENLTWLDGRCSPYRMALAYHPIVDLLKQLFHIDNSDSDADIRRKVQRGLETLNVDLDTAAPYLLHLLAVEVQDRLPSGLSPEALKQRIFEALCLLLLESAARQPLVVAIEDLHWIDNATEELLTFLLDQIAASRVLLVFTYRPDFASTWSRKSYHSVITLTRLAPDDSYRLLTALLGPAAIQDDLATLVLNKAEGVPFFIEELVQSLRETGAIELRQGEWQLATQDSAGQIPDTVDEVLMARIDRLPEGAKNVLQMGSVIGREFSGELLRELSGLTDRELVAHLAALTDAELIYASGLPSRPIYLFKHAFTQEAAYRSLLTARRREWHHRVAVTLEALFPDRLEEYYGQLAYHLVEAAQDDDIDKAIAYAIQAGDRNMALPAYAEAVRFYQMALDVIPGREGGNEAQRCELLLALGEAQRKAGELGASETLQRAADSARKLGWADNLARAALEVEALVRMHGLSTALAIQLLEDAVRELGEQDSVLRAKTLGSLARALRLAGRQQEARRDAQQALAMARRVGDPATLALTLHALIQTVWETTFAEQRLPYTNELLPLAEAASVKELVADGHAWRMTCLLELGDRQAADTELQALIRVTEDMQQPFYLYMAKTDQALHALMVGRFNEAQGLIEQALADGQRLQMENAAGTFGIQMFTLCREQGRLKGLEPAIRHFVRQHTVASTWRPGLALLYAELGRADEARTAFEDLAQHDFTDLPQDVLWTTCLTYLAEVCAFLGDADRAAILYQRLLPYARYNIVVFGVHCCGAASRYLGLLATTMGRWDEAEQHFEHALDMNVRLGARPLLAHTQHDYATMLQARNQPGDGDKAASLLHEALTTARELGMRALADRITGETDQEAAPLRSMPTDLDDLSPREIEVLRLIATGKSNRDIADTLFISLNTVATHVRNILTKTGCANRTEAATYAMRHGLSEA